MWNCLPARTDKKSHARKQIHFIIDISFSLCLPGLTSGLCVHDVFIYVFFFFICGLSLADTPLTAFGRWFNFWLTLIASNGDYLSSDVADVPHKKRWRRKYAKMHGIIDKVAYFENQYDSLYFIEFEHRVDQNLFLLD